MTLLESYDPTTDRIADAAALNAATSTAPFMDSARADSLRRRNRAVLFGNYAGSNLDWKPSFSEVLGLMLRTETTLGASLDRRETPNFAPLDNYNGVDAVMGTPYEAYALSFVFSRSPEETQYIKRDLDQAQKHQLVFSQSDMGTVLGTGFIAGILEPLNLIFGAAPGVMTSVGKSLIQAAKVGAKVSAAQAITVEAGLHYFQPERTLEQSTVDVGLSTAFGASLLPMIVLGKKLHNKMGIEHPELLRAMDESMQQEFRTGTTTGFTGHMNPGWRPERPGERRHAPGVNNPASPGARALPPHRRQGAKGQLFTRADAEPTGFKAYGAERISNILSKRDLVLNGSIPASARAMENLLTTPSYLEKNFNNVATDLPVAREMKTWEATLAEFLTDVNHAHSAYRMRVAKKEGKASFLDKTGFIVDDLRNKTSPARNADDPEGPLSIIAFREEITTALRGVDDTGKIEHRIPEVQQMAQRVRDTNDYIFKEAVAVGIMKESDYRSNFIQRMWDQPEVYKNESRLYNMIWKWQKDNLPSELRDSPQQLSEKIKTIHVSVDGLDNITGEGFEGAKGIFKERTINVPDELIADFLVHDIDHIMRSYVRLASADIEIARKFGSISMEKTFEFIRREAADMDAKAATGSKQQLVAEKHIEYLEAYRDILRGVYQLPSDPYSISSRTARMVLDFNTWTMLGGATLASIPDVGRSVMMNGLSPTFHGVRALIKDFDTWKVAAKEVKLAGTALDMILQTRALALTHHGDLPQRYTRAEKIAGYMTNGFFIANFLSPWNAFMKQAVGVSTSHRILELVKQDVNGTISAKNRTRLRAAYITLEDSRLIDNAFNKYGETVNGLKLPNTERWAEDPRRPVRTEEPIDQPVLIRDRYSDERMPIDQPVGVAPVRDIEEMKTELAGLETELAELVNMDEGAVRRSIEIRESYPEAGYADVPFEESRFANEKVTNIKSWPVGRPFSGQAYQGRGGEPKAEFGEPVFGPDISGELPSFLSVNPGIAARYGDEVVIVDVNLQNPFVIRNLEGFQEIIEQTPSWGEVIRLREEDSLFKIKVGEPPEPVSRSSVSGSLREAGVIADFTSSRRKFSEAVKEMADIIRDKGHDGIIIDTGINTPKGVRHIESSLDSQNDFIKTFTHGQIIAFNRQSVSEPKASFRSSGTINESYMGESYIQEHTGDYPEIAGFPKDNEKARELFKRAEILAREIIDHESTVPWMIFEDIIDLAKSIDRTIKENPNAGIAAASEFFVPGQVVKELTPERLIDEINALRHAIDTGDTVDITIALNSLVRKLPPEDLDIGGSYAVLDDLMKSEKIIGRSTSLARQALARAHLGEGSGPRAKELLEVRRLFDEIIAGIAGKIDIDVTTSTQVGSMGVETRVTQVGPVEVETRVKKLPYKNRKEAIAHYENFLADEKIRALFSEQWAGDILPKMEADLRDYKAGRKPNEVRYAKLDFIETTEKIRSLVRHHVDKMADEGMPDAGPSIPGKELPEVFNRLDVIINRLERYSDQQDTSTPKSINIDELDELISGLGTTEVGPQGVLSSARIARNKEVSIEVKRIVDDFRQQIDTLRTAIKNENIDDIKIASAAISRLIEETRPPTGLGRLPLINPKAEKLHAHPRAKLAEAINLLEMEDTVGKARDTLFQRIDEIVAITGPLGRDFRGAPTGHKEAVEVNKALNKQFKTLHAKYTLLKRSPKRVLGLVRDNISLIQEYFGSHTARLVLSDVEEIANGAKLGSKRDQFGIKDSMDEVLDLTRDLIDKDPSDFDFTTPMPDTGQGVSPPEIPPVSDGRRASENLRAQKVFRAALSRDVDQAIVTPEAGDLPLFTYKIWGRLLGQYKSFIASAFHKVLIPGMQMHDAQTVLGMMMMTFLGGLVTMIRDKQNGVPLADSPLEFVVDGIDQAGLTSWFFVANNAVEAWSDNRYGLRPGLGIGPWWPTSMRWKLGTALGPSASQAVRAGQIMGDLLSGEADWRTRRSAWRLVPGNNLLPLNLGNVIQFNNWMDRMQEFPTPDMEAASLATEGLREQTANRMASLLSQRERPGFDPESLSNLDKTLMRSLEGEDTAFLVRNTETGTDTLMELSAGERVSLR